MTQDAEHTDRDRDASLLHGHDNASNQVHSDNDDDEEAFPPSYEEAISHIDDTNNTSTAPSSITVPQQPVLSPPLTHQQLQHSDEIHNEQQQPQGQHSRQPTDQHGNNNNITFGDSSTPLKPIHAPSAPPAASPAAGPGSDQGGSNSGGSSSAPHLNTFGHPHMNPFHQHQHPLHQHHQHHQHQHQHQHPSSSSSSSSMMPGFGMGIPPAIFGGLPPGSFPFLHHPSAMPPGVGGGAGGFPGPFQPPLPPGVFGIPGQGQGGFPSPSGFGGFPTLPRPSGPAVFPFSGPGRFDGKGTFGFGGPGGSGQVGGGEDDTTSVPGFSFGQTEAAAPASSAAATMGSGQHGSSPSSGNNLPSSPAPPAPPAPPVLPSMPVMPAMPPMPPAHPSSPSDVPELPELPKLPTLPSISPPSMGLPPSASIPSDTTPTSGSGAVAVDDSLPPSFFMATTTSESRPVPPSGIPSLEGAPTGGDISKATYARTDRGVESQDALLEDPFQLYRFFVAHNDKPQMHILITGTHVEKRSKEKRRSDGSVSTVYSKAKVCDFKIDLDLSSFISPYGTIKTLPDPKTSNKLSLREVIEQHITEENPFKEMHMKKKVSWDYEDLTRAIVHAIRSVNYRYKIEISYPTSNNRVIVHSASPLAQFMRSAWTKTFCGLSLVGIVFYPLREYYKVVKDKNIQSEFHMTISTADFMRNSYWKIVDQVQFKNE